MISNPHFLNANMYIPPSQADYIPGKNPKPAAVTVIRDQRHAFEDSEKCSGALEGLRSVRSLLFRGSTALINFQDFCLRQVFISPLLLCSDVRLGEKKSSAPG